MMTKPTPTDIAILKDACFYLPGLIDSIERVSPSLLNSDPVLGKIRDDLADCVSRLDEYIKQATLDHRWTHLYSHVDTVYLDLGDEVGEAEVEYVNGTYHWYVWVGDTGHSYHYAAERGTADSFLEGQRSAEEAMRSLGMLKKENP